MEEYRKAVVMIVEFRGKILVGKKIKSGTQLSECWHIPGGKVEEGETDEQAAVREVEEEAGIKVRVKGFLDSFVNNKTGWIANWYLCTATTTETRHGDDLADAKFVAKEDAAKICDPQAVALWPKKVRDYFGIDRKKEKRA